MSAYNAGATGKGVKIGIIDTGLNASLSEFSGKLDAGSVDISGTRGMGDDDGHGTMVSAIAAAAKNDVDMHGVAFDSTIVAVRADTPRSCTTTDGCSFDQAAIAKGIDAARTAGAKVINLSLAGEAPTTDTLAAVQRAVDAGIVIVMAAGYDIGTSPDIFARTVAQNFAGKVIIAGSVGVDDGKGGVNLDSISDFSNKAGTSASSFLTARGLDVLAPDATGEDYLWFGADVAAPSISGAVALLAQAFPNLTGQQIVQLLFSSADDLGVAGVDAVYGNGRLNLAKAFAPKGTTMLAKTTMVVDSSTISQLPAAAGDAASTGSLGAVILDGFSRAYVMNLAATMRQAAQDYPLFRALDGNLQNTSLDAGPISIAMTVAARPGAGLGFSVDRLGIGPEDARKARLVAGSAVAHLNSKTLAAFGISESATSLRQRLSGAESSAFLIAKDGTSTTGSWGNTKGSMALRRQAGRFGLFAAGETGEVRNTIKANALGSPYRWASFGIDRDFGRTWLFAGLSRLQETDTVLGGRMNQVLGGGGASSIFLDVDFRRRFGSGVSAGLSARRGSTSFAGGKFQTAAYAMDVSKLGILNANDRIGLRFSQPLRVDSGGFNLLLPISYDYDALTATDSWQHFSMRPSGREVDGELSYSSSVIGDAGWLSANLYVRKDPEHVASARPDVGSAIRFSLKF